MTELALNGTRAITAHFVLPSARIWTCDLEFDTEIALPAGLVLVTFGDLELRGTIDPDHSGTFQLQTRCRVIGGAAGWWKPLATRHGWTNDAGVKASDVAQWLATQVGETLQSPPTDRLGSYFEAVEGMAAARILDLAAPGWYVDVDGVTKWATRSSVTDPKAYDLIDYRPDTRIARIATSTPGILQPGTQLTGKFARPVTVRAAETTFTKGAARSRIWVSE